MSRIAARSRRRYQTGMFDTCSTYADGTPYRQRAIGDRYFVDYVDADSRTLVITFFAVGMINPRTMKEDYPWGFKFVARTGVSVLGIKPMQQDWYRGAELHAFLRSTEFASFVAGFDRVILYGTSMGAYGALVFSDAIPGCEVIALNPQSSLDTRLVPWEPRFREGQAQNWDGDFADAAIYAAKARRVHVTYDPVFRLDRMHVERLPTHNLVALTVPYVGHSTTAWLAKLDLLKGLFQEIVAGDVDIPRFYRNVRRRRELAHYYLELARHARERHPRVRTWALDHAAGMASTDIAGLFEIGDMHIAAREYDAAEAVLGRAIDLKPQYPQGYYRLSQAHLKRGDFKSAIRRAQAALNRAPRNAVYHKWLRDVQAAQIAAEESAAATEQVQRQEAAFAEKLAAAEAALIGGDDEMAHAALVDAIALKPDVPAGYHRMSRLYRKRNDLPAAIRFAEDAIARAPDNRGFRTWLETLRARQRSEIDAAVLAAERAALAAAHAKEEAAFAARLASANEASAIGDYATAYAALAAAIELKPGAPIGYHRMSQLYRKRNDLPAAIRFAEDAIARAPSNPGFRTWLETLRVRQQSEIEAAALAAERAALAAAHAKAEAAFAARLASANEASAIGDYATAHAALAAAIELKPGAPIGYHRMSQLYRKRNDLPAAIRFAEDAIARAPDNRGFRTWLETLRVRQQGEIEAAALAAAHAKAEAAFAARLASANEASAIGDYATAHAALAAAIELKPGAPIGYHRMSQLYRKRNDLPAAIRFAEDAIAKNGAKPVYRKWLASLQQAQRLDEAAAVRTAERALIAEEKRRVEATFANHIAAAERAITAGDHDAAASALTSAIAVKPDSPAGYHRLSKLHRKRRDWTDAIATAQQALDRAPRNPLYLNWLSAVRDAEQASSQAAEQTREARALAAEEARIALEAEMIWRALLARAGASASDASLAETILREAIALRPSSPTGYHRMSRLYRKHGDLAAAIRLAREAVERAPDNSIYRDWERTLHDAERKQSEAQAFAQRSRELKARIDEFLSTADVQMAAGDPGAAAQTLERVISTWPDHAAAYHRMSRLRRKQKDLPAALRFADDAVARAPSNQIFRNWRDSLLDIEAADARETARKEAVRAEEAAVAELFRRADAHRARSEFGDAAAILDEVIAARPDHALGFHRLSHIRRQQRDLPGAIACAEAALARAPTNAVYQAWLDTLRRAR